MLLFADRLEEQSPAGEVYVRKGGLPVSGCELGPIQFERSTLVQLSQDAHAEIHVFGQVPRKLHQSLLPRLDPQYARHRVKHFGLARRGIEVGIRPEREIDDAVLVAFVFEKESCGYDLHQLARLLLILMFGLLIFGLSVWIMRDLLQARLLSLQLVGRERTAVLRDRQF